MNNRRAAGILRSIVKLATEPNVPAEEKLDSLNSFLDSHKCARCGVDWDRGGNQQGSALCDSCYKS